jgi:Tol biopolymer transport system component
VCLLIAFVVLGPSSASAAFPGRNGAIAVGYKSSLQIDGHASIEERSIRLRSPDGPDQMLYGCRDTSPECAAKSYTDPAFAPSGRPVVFDAGASLALVNVDGSGFRQLPAHSDDDGQPAFSPTGDRIAFVVHHDKSRVTSVWTCDATDGAGARLVVRDGGTPAWSTRNWIAFARGEGIYRVRPDGSGLRRLTRNGFAPAWSPNGRRLAFTREGVYRHGTQERAGGLFIMNADGTHAHSLPEHAISYGVYDLAWSPDGRRLLAYPEHIVAVGLHGRLLQNYGGGENSGGEFSSRDFGLDWRPLP